MLQLQTKSIDAGLASFDAARHGQQWGSEAARRLHGAPWSRGLNAVPYCSDRQLPGDSRTVVGPSAASDQPLVQQGTPVQKLFLGFQVGLKAVPKGPPLLTWELVPGMLLNELQFGLLGANLGAIRRAGQFVLAVGKAYPAVRNTASRMAWL